MHASKKGKGLFWKSALLESNVGCRSDQKRGGTGREGPNDDKPNKIYIESSKPEFLNALNLKALCSLGTLIRNHK